MHIRFARHLGILAAAFLLAAPASSPAQVKQWFSSASAGIIQHSEHPAGFEYPFSNGDLSYPVAYEYHEGNSYWQIGAVFSPHVSATSTVGSAQSVISPQLSLVYTWPRVFAGIGITKHYVKYENMSQWSSLFWHAQVGVRLPVTDVFELRAAGYYQFRNLGDLGDFDLRELEWGVSVAYAF